MTVVSIYGLCGSGLLKASRPLLSFLMTPVVDPIDIRSSESALELVEADIFTSESAI